MATERTPFLRSVLSGPDGSASTARLCVLLIVVSAIAWVSYLVYLHRELPSFDGLTLWVTTTSASLYGVNKAAAIFSPKKDVPPCP